jgi:hypothetical protein
MRTAGPVARADFQGRTTVAKNIQAGPSRSAGSYGWSGLGEVPPKGTPKPQIELLAVEKKKLYMRTLSDNVR